MDAEPASRVADVHVAHALDVGEREAMSKQGSAAARLSRLGRWRVQNVRPTTNTRNESAYRSSV